MKKILLSTIILIAFSLSIIMFEISCKKSANAQSPAYILPIATTKTLGGVIPDGTSITVDASGKISATLTAVNVSSQQNKILIGIEDNSTAGVSLYTMNYDGTGLQKINITFPNSRTISSDPKISPDGKTIILQMQATNTGGVSYQYIYACNIDGTNLHQIYSPSPATANFQTYQVY